MNGRAFFNQRDELLFTDEFLFNRDQGTVMETAFFCEDSDLIDFEGLTYSSMSWQFRLAQESDTPALHALIEASIRGLQAGDYTPAQIEGAIGTVLGLDTQLIRDQTYFVAECTADPGSTPRIAGCGGWSYRKTLFGSDGASTREPELLNPATDAAKVRAIFVHPDFARQGLGSLILSHVEQTAQAAGFHKFEMGSTLTGVPLYTLKGYRPTERVEVPLPNGEALTVVRMIKEPFRGKSWPPVL